MLKKITDYINIKLEIFKLRMMSHLARLMSHLIVFASLVFLGGLIVLFLSIAVSEYINFRMQSSFVGYFMVAGAYLLIFVLVGILARTGVIQRFLEELLLKLNDQPDEEDE